MKAYEIVLPTKLKPRRFKSLLIESDSSVRAGTSLNARQAFWIGRPPTNDQMYRSNVPNSSCTAKNALAFLIADAILSRLRTIPALANRLFSFRAIPGNARWVEPVEGGPVVLALVEDRLPAQAGLSSFEDQELEQQPIVVDRHAPLVVVIVAVERPRGPGTAQRFDFLSHGSPIEVRNVSQSILSCFARSGGKMV